MAVTAGQEYGLFIGGEVVESASGEVRDLHEPATGEPLARAAMAGEADIDRAVEAARDALDGPWGKTPPNERARLLHALADAIVANRKELAELESRNVGKAISSVKAEVAGAVENFRFFASVVGSIAGRSNPIGGSLLSYTLKEPVGVCAQIVPWNYPLLMSVWKLSPALAAGCSVVLKPDPQTPLSVLRIAELAAEVGFPAGAINIVPADGPKTGAYLVKHPGVDKVAFTGSTAHGERDHAALLRADQAPDARARRQEPGDRLRRRESRRRDSELGLVDLLRGRPELRGALARARRGLDLRRLRCTVRRRGEAAQSRRPAGCRDAGRLAHLDRAPRPRPRLRREGSRGGSRGRGRAARPATAQAPSTRRRCSRESRPR